MKYTKKLIEVALPLDAINAASVREKSIRHGHPSTLHLWWARKPLATARAVIFAQMVDDPSEYVDLLLSDPKKRSNAERDLHQRCAEREAQRASEEKLFVDGDTPTLEDILAEHERDRLFEIIRALVKWESTTDEVVLQQARDEIWQSWHRTCARNANHPQADELFNRDNLPRFHDPFAGGGTLPLEAQRLGLEALASDLNPVAVLLNKALIEIPPLFTGRPPVNIESRPNQSNIQMGWRGASGLADDVRYYGNLIRKCAEKSIGDLYPKIQITAEMANDRIDLNRYKGQNLNVIAWLWTRTVNSPNPAFSNVSVPLVSSFILSKKRGKNVYIQPIIKNDSYQFLVKCGPISNPQTGNGTSIGKRKAFKCLISSSPISYEYIRNEGKAGRMKLRLLAIIAEGDRERVYLSPNPEHEARALSAISKWKPDISLPHNPRDFKTPLYGFSTFADLFTERQLLALTTFSDLVMEVRERIEKDARNSGLVDDGSSLQTHGTGAIAYADAVATFLGVGVGRAADYWNANATWQTGGFVAHAFTRQAIPMVWNFAESNPFSSSSGNWINTAVSWISKVLESLPEPHFHAKVNIQDATNMTSEIRSHNITDQLIISTDPPYFDNISFADLSDFFYLWLRRSLQSIHPELFKTILTPKSTEMVATPQRHETKSNAGKFFLDGMERAMSQLSSLSHPTIPMTVYYAFKQSESITEEGSVSTGWEKFLDAVIRAGLEVRGTWPIRTERGARSLAIGTNALASSIILVCRPRPIDASIATLGTFINSLKHEIPHALKDMQQSGIAPVDLAQAAIGPGIAVYSRHANILDAEGKSISVRDALGLINQTLHEVMTEQESDFDADTRWALAWFEHHGFTAGDYGVAETLSKAKNSSVTGLVDAGILRSYAGKVRLLRPEELPNDWDPRTDPRLTSWETVHHLIQVLATDGEEAAADLIKKLGGHAEAARDLCYQLYTLSERKKWFADATRYNTLVKSWPEIALRARAQPVSQSEMFGERMVTGDE